MTSLSIPSAYGRGAGGDVARFGRRAGVSVGQRRAVELRAAGPALVERDQLPVLERIAER
jgi:hypothetical protein